jgi:hypothetical protein
MKIILVIQSLIILAGAYHIYTLAYPTKEVEEVVEVAPLPTSTPAIVEVEATTTVETKSTTPAPGAGPNDAGMEWPVFEGELEVR